MPGDLSALFFSDLLLQKGFLSLKVMSNFHHVVWSDQDFYWLEYFVIRFKGKIKTLEKERKEGCCVYFRKFLID